MLVLLLLGLQYYGGPMTDAQCGHRILSDSGECPERWYGCWEADGLCKTMIWRKPLHLLVR